MVFGGKKDKNNNKILRERKTEQKEENLSETKSETSTYFHWLYL